MLWDSQTLSGHGTNLKPGFRVERRNGVVTGAPPGVPHGMLVATLRRGAANVSHLKRQLITQRREGFEFPTPSCMPDRTFRSWRVQVTLKHSQSKRRGLVLTLSVYVTVTDCTGLSVLRRRHGHCNFQRSSEQNSHCRKMPMTNMESASLFSLMAHRDIAVFLGHCHWVYLPDQKVRRATTSMSWQNT